MTDAERKLLMALAQAVLNTTGVIDNEDAEEVSGLLSDVEYEEAFRQKEQED